MEDHAADPRNWPGHRGEERAGTGQEPEEVREGIVHNDHYKAPSPKT